MGIEPFMRGRLRAPVSLPITYWPPRPAWLTPLSMAAKAECCFLRRSSKFYLKGTKRPLGPRSIQELLNLTKQHARIDPAKSEGVAQRIIDLFFPRLVGYDI